MGRIEFNSIDKLGGPCGAPFWWLCMRVLVSREEITARELAHAMQATHINTCNSPAGVVGMTPPIFELSLLQPIPLNLRTQDRGDYDKGTHKGSYSIGLGSLYVWVRNICVFTSYLLVVPPCLHFGTLPSIPIHIVPHDTPVYQVSEEVRGCGECSLPKVGPELSDASEDGGRSALV